MANFSIRTAIILVVLVTLAILLILMMTPRPSDGREAEDLRGKDEPASAGAQKRAAEPSANDAKNQN